jgi:hypothetical protein
MTNIQMFFALGALMLLSLIIINTNKNTLYTEDVMYDSNFGITATSVGASIIEEASQKNFDEITDTIALDATKNNDLNLLTAPGSLGTEGSEDINDRTTFNDFDDYNNYTAVDNSMPTAIFNIECSVNYVDSNNPDVAVNSRTYHKKLTIKISSISMRDTIVQSTVFSYWYY